MLENKISKCRVLRLGFSIMELIISIALLSALITYIFAFATPLRISAGETEQILVEYSHIQFITLYLDQLMRMDNQPDIITSDQLVESFDIFKSIPDIQDIDKSIPIPKRNNSYITFNILLGTAVCGEFEGLQAGFGCLFIYQHRYRFYSLASGAMLQSMRHRYHGNSVIFDQGIQFNLVKGSMNQLHTNIAGYSIVAGFVPSIKQMVQ